MAAAGRGNIATATPSMSPAKYRAFASFGSCLARSRDMLNKLPLHAVLGDGISAKSSLAV